ncbi:class I SAM-dependent methyltransferase [Aurantiacibacter flavus]|uniref:Class I SAM-dependent methyltransferase n=1 Tax=Aurantiacibacter flavus TaxID=3145232 RepID=A0ABV0CUN3_9SPHN
MSGLRSLVALASFALLAACQQPDDARAPGSQEFPKADRPVSAGGATAFSNEEARDRRQEAETVMDLAGIEPGMSVADVGAGEGYYTVRLAARVGETGRVLANDINEDALRRLGSRVERDRLDNVSIKPGLPDDPRLPVNSFDRIMLVHMYHEVEEPYAFLWRVRPALREKGHVVVVDVDRPIDQHGISPQLLFCEFARVGYRLTEFVRKPEIAGYYAEFEAVGERPEPSAIEPCVQADVEDMSATS